MSFASITYLKDNGFNPNRFDPNVCIKDPTSVYNYTRTHTDDEPVLSADPTSIFDKLKEIYTIKKFGTPKLHLGYYYRQVKMSATIRWVMGYSTYTDEVLQKVCALFKVKNL